MNLYEQSSIGGDAGSAYATLSTLRTRHKEELSKWPDADKKALSEAMRALRDVKDRLHVAEPERMDAEEAREAWKEALDDGQ